MKLFTKVALCTLPLGCSQAEAPSRFDGDRALTYVEAQMNFGPRIPNSPGHRQTGDWILNHLQGTADSVEVQEFVHVSAAGDSLALRNFMGRFRTDLTERILFVAHWDTRPLADRSANLADQRRPVPGANDGASGVAILLGVADVLDSISPSVGVDLLFVDGEDFGDFGTDTDVLIGARYFAENLPDGYQPLFGVLFDLVGDADLSLPKEGYSVERAPEVVDRVWRTAASLGYASIFRARVAGSVTDDHLPLLDAGIRIIDIIDFTYPPHHTTEDTIDKVSARSLEIVGNVAVALLRN